MYTFYNHKVLLIAAIGILLSFFLLTYHWYTSRKRKNNLLSLHNIPVENLNNPACLNECVAYAITLGPFSKSLTFSLMLFWYCPEIFNFLNRKSNIFILHWDLQILQLALVDIKIYLVHIHTCACVCRCAWSCEYVLMCICG